MPTARFKRLLAETGLVYAALVWGSTFFLVKQTLEACDPLVLIGYRFSLAALLLGLWHGLRPGRRCCELRQNLRPGLLLGLLLALLYIAQTVGLAHTTASNSGFITGLFIVFVPPIGWLWLRQRVRSWQVCAVLVATAGLWLLTAQLGAGGLGLGGLNRGDGITLLAAVTYAFHVVLAGRLMSARLDPIVLCFQQMLVTALLAWLAHGALALPQLLSGNSAALWEPLVVRSAPAWGAMVFLAVVPTLSAFLVQLYAQRVIDSTRTALILVLEPIFAALFAWSVGQELFRPVNALGGLLIVLAMVISELPWARLLDQRALRRAGGQ